MVRKRLTITLNKNLLKKVDQAIDGVKIRNRSHAIEYLLTKTLTPKVEQAVILAGGPAVKMRPLTYEIPKALIPIGGRPLIESTIELIKDAGIRNLVIATGHLGHKIQEQLGEGRRLGVKISYTFEKKPVGTAGAILNARNLLGNKPFLVANGDVLADINLSELIEFHQKDKYLATMAVSSVSDTLGYGIVFLRGEKVVKFLNKSPKRGLSTHLINAGFYILSPKIFDHIPAGKKVHLREIFPKLASQGQLAGFSFEGHWADISTPKNYEQAIKTMARYRKK